jgi:hypothetical protein
MVAVRSAIHLSPLFTFLEPLQLRAAINSAAPIRQLAIPLSPRRNLDSVIESYKAEPVATLIGDRDVRIGWQATIAHLLSNNVPQARDSFEVSRIEVGKVTSFLVDRVASIMDV